ncbi:hypothetical protein J3R82DRAFT_2388 [Butyriboletus roseoflavus]|nr:hypothetical protein J3R82DRAFT_2388 [Butyriboletus roseoflavus]
MDADLGHWSEPYSSLYGLMGNDEDYAESGDISYDMRYFFTADPANMVDFIHPSIPTHFPHAASFGDTSYAQNLLYLPPGSTSSNQRQQANQQLHIDTQLSPCQINDSENSTASSTSFKVLETPYFELYPSFQPSIHVPLPGSASSESRLLMPDVGKLSPLPVSPLSLYSPNFEGDTLEAPASPLPVEPHVVTQVLMPHILEWKRVIMLCGTNDFVPQTVYQPYTEADRKRYIRDVELKETIFFHTDDSSELGVSLDDALKQKLGHLNGKDHRMFNDCGPSVSIRIQWPGYAPWSKQIPTMDFKTPKGHITRAKLAKNIATCVSRFAADMQEKPMEAESDIRWKIGEQHIKVGDLILVSLHHVSKGSWQPQLRLRSPFATFSYQWDESFPSVPAS